MRIAIHETFKSLGISQPAARTPTRLRPPEKKARSLDEARTRRAHKAGLSRIGVAIWRVIAHGTKPGRPCGILVFWPRWERLAHRLWPTQEIPRALYGLLQLRFKHYKGAPLKGPDGFTLANDAIVAELHCHNPRFLRCVTDLHLNPYAACREDLHSLARWLKKDPSVARFDALYGRTMLASASARLGFTVQESPRGIRRSLDRFFMIGLMLIYTDLGLQRLTHGTTPSSNPSIVFMSRSRLLKMYGNRDARELDRDAAPTNVVTIKFR